MTTPAAPSCCATCTRSSRETLYVVLMYLYNERLHVEGETCRKHTQSSHTHTLYVDHKGGGGSLLAAGTARTRLPRPQNAQHLLGPPSVLLLHRVPSAFRRRACRRVSVCVRPQRGELLVPRGHVLGEARHGVQRGLLQARPLGALQAGEVVDLVREGGQRGSDGVRRDTRKGRGGSSTPWTGRKGPRAPPWLPPPLWVLLLRLRLRPSVLEPPRLPPRPLPVAQTWAWWATLPATGRWRCPPEPRSDPSTYI